LAERLLLAIEKSANRALLHAIHNVYFAGKREKEWKATLKAAWTRQAPTSMRMEVLGHFASLLVVKVILQTEGIASLKRKFDFRESLIAISK
jgi:hypothetical protein